MVFQHLSRTARVITFVYECVGKMKELSLINIVCRGGLVGEYILLFCCVIYLITFIYGNETSTKLFLRSRSSDCFEI